MGFCQVNQHRIHFQDAGSGESMVLIHGLGSHSEDWGPQQEYFSRNYRVITVDLRGHGRSDAPSGPYSVPQYAQDVLGVMDQLRIEKAHIVGLSMGGMTAFQLAADAPHRIISMVIINSAPEVICRTWKQRLLIWQRLLMIHLLGMHVVGRVIGKRLFPEPGQRPLYQRFASHVGQIDKKVYLSAVRSFLGWSVVSRLPQMTMPILVVSADHDYTPVSAKESYARLLPNARLIVIENSRHATPIDQPDRLNREIELFLTNQPAKQLNF